MQSMMYLVADDAPILRFEPAAVLLLCLALAGCTNGSIDSREPTSTTATPPVDASDDPFDLSRPVDPACDEIRPEASVTPLITGTLGDVAAFLAEHMELGALEAEPEGGAAWSTDRASIRVIPLDFRDATPDDPYDPALDVFNLGFGIRNSLPNLSAVLPLTEALDQEAEWTFAETLWSNSTRLVHQGLEWVDPTMIHGGLRDRPDGDDGVINVVFQGAFTWNAPAPLPVEQLRAASMDAMSCYAGERGLAPEAFTEIDHLVNQEYLDGHARWVTTFDHPPNATISRDCHARVETAVDPVNGSWSAYTFYDECGKS